MAHHLDEEIEIFDDGMECVLDPDSIIRAYALHTGAFKAEVGIHRKKKKKHSHVLESLECGSEKICHKSNEYICFQNRRQ